MGMLVGLRVLEGMLGKMGGVKGLFKHGTVADDVNFALIQHSAGEKVEGEFFALHNKCVTSVRTAVKSRNNIVFCRQDIDKFPLPFITPLGTQNGANLVCVGTRLFVSVLMSGVYDNEDDRLSVISFGVYLFI